jgi:threonine dehydratase
VKPIVRQTPLIRVRAVEDRLGAGVALKLECLQRTGSFKLRGAVAQMLALSEAQRLLGVVAASAGNHGLGVALAGSELGVPVTVVVPETVPPVKRDGIARLGATLIVEGKTNDAAEAAARARADATGMAFASPYDDEWVIEGNGDGVAGELLMQAPDLARVVCPVGGGGLLGGLARTLAPRDVEVIGVQPRANCAMHDSLAAGRALTEYTGEPTLAEGCEGAVADRTFQLARRHVTAIELVSEPAIRGAIAFLYRTAGVIAEPSAAVAMAGLLEGVVRPAATGTTAVVITGGNIEPELLDEILSENR